jgi:multisubunit Na+/H+ antiporter MnhC subunit
MTQIVLILGFSLSLIGIWGITTQKNIFKIILGFSILDTGVHLIMVALGYIKGGTAPIFDEALNQADALGKVVDPVPSALVLTAIVIGLAVTALMLSYGVRLYESTGTLSIDEIKELKW